MHFTYVPSLQQLSTSKIVSQLWDHPRVKSRWVNLCHPPYHDYEWMENMNEFVMERAKRLNLPSAFDEELAFSICTIGEEIKRLVNQERPQWKNLMDRRHWTAIGTVDLPKLAESLIEDGTAGIEYCFYVACAYCLQDKIYYLWPRVTLTPDEWEKSFPSSDPNYSTVQFWMDVVSKKRTTLEELKRRDFEAYGLLIEGALTLATKNGNVVAARFFYDKLPRRFKTVQFISQLANDCVLLCYLHIHFVVPQECCVWMLRDLLNHLEESAQMEVVRSRRCVLLTAFTDCPWTDVIVGVANLCWQCLQSAPEDELYLLVMDRIFINDVVNNLWENKRCPESVMWDLLSNIPDYLESYIHERCSFFIHQNIKSNGIRELIP